MAAISLIEQQRVLGGMRLVKMQDARRRIQVAGLFGPLLTLALVGGQFQYAPIRQMIGFVAIEYGLYQIVARGQRSQAPRRPAKGVVIENCSLAGRQSPRR